MRLTFDSRFIKILSQTFAVMGLISALVINLVMVKIATRSLLDFGSFIASGVSLRDGANPYSDSSPLIFEIYFPEAHAGGKLPNLNPPITLLLLHALPNADPLLLANWWRGISFLLYLIAILLLIKDNRGISPLRILWLFALAGFWHTIELGQIYIPLLLVLILAWSSSLRRNDRYFGILLGLLASIKPNFLLWILFVCLSRNWKAVLYAAITLALVAAVPLVIYGPSVYVQWWYATQLGKSILAMPGNSSFFGLASRFSYPQAGLLLSAVLVTFLLLRGYHIISRQSLIGPQAINEMGILSSLLASPISWLGYTIFAVPIFLSQARWSPLLMMSAAILSVPFILVLSLYTISLTNSVIWGWFYGAGLLLILINQLTKRSDQA